MAGSITNQFARLLKRDKLQWSEPEKSIGIFYCKMGRDNSCWEAVGAARETLVRVGTQVKTHLDTDSYPTTETIILALCMIGKTKETAQPWIMICCKDARCRRRMRKTVEESGILDEYPIVRVGDCSKQPDIDKLLPLAGVTNDTKLSTFDTGPGAGISETDIYYDPSKNLFGTQLYIKDSKPKMPSWKKATAGGIVALGNRYFYMTVAHVFTDEAKLTSGNGSDSEFEFDIGQNESEDEENELIETTSRASITPEPDDYASSNSSKIISDAPESPPSVSHEERQQNSHDDEAKDQFAVINDIEKSKTFTAVGLLAKLSTNGPHPDLDYALIEIQRPDFPTFNCIQLSETTLLVPKQVAKIKSQNTSIITATGSSGVLKGILSGTPSFLKSPSSTIFQEVWTVRLDGKLAEGDSGSWVVDSETGALLGHIVAGSPATGVAYVTPSIQIFTDLRTRFGGEFRLPLPVADESTKTAIDGLSLIGLGEPVNTKEEVGLLGNDSGQHDSGRPESKMDTESVAAKSSTQKARRASRPKVKTGCNNCKNRRVKCDETRPQCTKCVRSGRHCDGYPAYKWTVEFAIPFALRPSSDGSPYHYRALPRASPHQPPTSRSVAIQKPIRVVQKRPPSPSKSVVKISPTTYQPGWPAFDPQERQYFQFFQTHTANELSGFFDSEFWTRSVLQESYSEASILHAVIALGALYKTLEKASESPPGSPNHDGSVNSFDTASNHYRFALKQYCKAISRLREVLQSNKKRPQRTILISMVLFICFESFTGDYRGAILQIQHGLGLLEERRHEANQPIRQHKNDFVEEELIQVFTRLAIQAKSCDIGFHFPPPHVIRLSPNKPDSSAPQSPSLPWDAASDASLNPHYPETFATSLEARSALDSLCERMMRFNEILSSYHPGPNYIIPAHLKVQGASFKTQMMQWASAFNPLLQSRRHPEVSNTERAGINVLRMLSLSGSILFLMGYSSTENDFDKYFNDFKEIVDLAKEVVLDKELTLAQACCGKPLNCRHTQSNRQPRHPAHYFTGLALHQPDMYREEDSYCHIKASFALDLGIVAPLFVVATKCRDRKVRREAIGLLMSSPRREGMWDSILCGRVGHWIMEIEEEGLTPWDGPFGQAAKETVREDYRVMVKEILFDLQKREATLRCGTRGAIDGDGDRRARETHILW